MPLAKARSTQIHSVQPYQFYLTVVWGWNKKMIPAEWNYVERIISPIYGLKKRKNLICKFYKIESELLEFFAINGQFQNWKVGLSIILPWRMRRMNAGTEYYNSLKNEANLCHGGALYYLVKWDVYAWAEYYITSKNELNECRGRVLYYLKEWGKWMPAGAEYFITSKNEANVCRGEELYYLEEWGECIPGRSILLPQRRRQMCAGAEILYYLKEWKAGAEYYIKNEANVCLGGVLYYLKNEANVCQSGVFM